jgi:hypothetical protein
MLESYCYKARLMDGLDILDLGCGARDFAHSRILILTLLLFS